MTGPLRRGQQTHGYALDMTRCYGYSHSSGEAVQLANFLQGNFTPDSEVWPLISRSHSFHRIAEEAHAPADLYVVELSSAKRIQIDDYFVQLNYLTNAYHSFFAQDARARRFWMLATDGDTNKTDQFLRKNGVTAEDRKVLSRVRVELTSPAQLVADIETLQTMLPRVLLVTHVNARKPDGKLIPSRDRFLQMVKAAAQQTGAKVYDPTRLMVGFGQKEAIEDHSDGLAHYTDAFSDALIADWSDSIMGPYVEDITRTSTSDVYLPYANSLIQRQQYVALRQSLRRVARYNPTGIKTAQKALISAEKSAEKRLRDLSNSKNSDSATHLDALELAAGLGRYDDTLIPLEGLAELNALPREIMLRDLAAKAHENGQSRSAQTILTTVLENGGRTPAVALQLSALLLETCTTRLSPVPQDIQNQLLWHAAPIDALRLSEKYGWDWWPDANTVSADDIVEIAAHFVLAEQPQKVLRIIAEWRSGSNGSPRLPDDLCVLLDKCCALACNRDLTTRVHLLNSILGVAPKHAAARNGLKSARLDLREALNEAVDVQDLIAVDTLADANDALPAPIKELNLYRARLHYEAEDYAKAIEIGLKATHLLPEKLALWVMLMRAAAKLERNDEIETYAQKVLALCNDQHGNLVREATRLRVLYSKPNAKHLRAVGGSKTPLVRRRKAGAA